MGASLEVGRRNGLLFRSVVAAAATTMMPQARPLHWPAGRLCVAPNEATGEPLGVPELATRGS